MLILDIAILRNSKRFESNSIFSNFEQIDDTQILNWLKNGQRKPNIQPGNHWLWVRSGNANMLGCRLIFLLLTTFFK